MIMFNLFIYNFRVKQSLNLWIIELRIFWGKHFSNETSNTPSALIKCSRANSDMKLNRHGFRYSN